jgi:hypothetical protein
MAMKSTRRLFVYLLLLAALAWPAMLGQAARPASRRGIVQAPLDEQAVRQILEGVKTIDAPGVPGPLAAFGGAAPLVAGEVGPHVRAPVVAAARWEAGRVVAFGHNGYLDVKSLATADTATLLLNALRWAAGANEQSSAVHVGVWKKSGLAAFLRSRGWQADVIDGSTDPARLAACRAICLDTHDLTNDRWLAALSQYTRQGGGLVAGGLGWGWLQLHPGKTIGDHPGNQLLAPAGILWLDGVAGHTAKAGYAVEPRPSRFCQGNQAIEAIMGQDRVGVRGNDLAQATWTIIHTAQALPPEDKLFRPMLERFLREHAPEAMPTKQHPLLEADAAGRLAVALRVEQIKQLPPRRVRADPSAAVFPGAVPPGTRRARRSISVDTSIPGWHSTGLYAPAGETVTASVSGGAAGTRFQIRIGCHTDLLWDKEKWDRCPEITVHKPLIGKTMVASPFGGPIYVEVGKPAGGTVSVTIAGGVEAPYFILGQTKPAQWRSIRMAPAPWAELATSKVILSVPSEVVRRLDDPVALLEHWDRVLDCDAELAGIPSRRTRPERYVPDVQISVGYMHSGYPIMTHLDVAPMMVDLVKLTQGDTAWGFYHEMGHNHQSTDWTFDGTTEVTVNLFTMYVIERLCHLPPMRGRAAPTNARQSKARAEYRAGGKDFETWKKEPFLALQMYVQLINAFGWDALKKVIAEYRTLPPAEHPKTDDDKRDEWMIRYSRTVGRNLGPFFDAWGVPVSAKAKATIANLPAWMPKEVP